MCTIFIDFTCKVITWFLRNSFTKIQGLFHDSNHIFYDCKDEQLIDYDEND